MYVIECFYELVGNSITHSNPRNYHLDLCSCQTTTIIYVEKCPCVSPYPGTAAPPFVGDNNFCESGITGSFQFGWWYLDDPLWNSQGCASACCDRGGQWFTGPKVCDVGICSSVWHTDG